MILSIDSASVTASAALCKDGKIVKSEFMNNGLTHSETLLPMVKRVMQGYRFEQLEAIAVTAGPGSFTGVRIGVSAAKGIAFAYDIPCVSVSSLEATAYNFTDADCIICVCMDARRMQFYNALFKSENGVIHRITPDRAISLDDLKKDVERYDGVVIAGDGARLCFENIGLDNISLAPQDKIYTNGEGVIKAAENKKRISASSLMPVYLRLSQAERELKLKKQ